MIVDTWNIAGAPNIVTKRNNLKPFDERFNNIVTDILKTCEHTDVLLLNEVFSKSDELVERLKPLFPYAVQSPKNKLFLNSGLVTLSKHRILRSGFVPFHFRGGWDVFAAKGFLWIDIERGNKGKFRIVNTHMQQGDGVWNTWARRSQIEDLKRFLIEDFTKFLIVGGDLNMGPESRSVDYEHFVDSCILDEVIWPGARHNSHIVRFLTRNLYRPRAFMKRKPWTLSDTHLCRLDLNKI